MGGEQLNDMTMTSNEISIIIAVHTLHCKHRCKNNGSPTWFKEWTGTHRSNW